METKGERYDMLLTEFDELLFQVRARRGEEALETESIAIGLMVCDRLDEVSRAVRASAHEVRLRAAAKGAYG